MLTDRAGTSRRASKRKWHPRQTFEQDSNRQRASGKGGNLPRIRGSLGTTDSLNLTSFSQICVAEEW